MNRQLHLNLFIHGRGHHEAAWRHPSASRLALTDIAYYTDLARKAEAGCFDSVFLADTPHGPYVVKWYNSLYANATQRATILELVKHGPPKKVSHRFVWPKGTRHIVELGVVRLPDAADRHAAVRRAG